VQVFTKLVQAQQHFVHKAYTKFYQNRTAILENAIEIPTPIFSKLTDDQIFVDVCTEFYPEQLTNQIHGAESSL
jgi:hypothetical protein